MQKQKLISKEQIQEFIKEKGLVTADDALGALKDLFKETLEEMLSAELVRSLATRRMRRPGCPKRTAGMGRPARKSEASLGKSS